MLTYNISPSIRPEGQIFKDSVPFLCILCLEGVGQYEFFFVLLFRRSEKEMSIVYEFYLSYLKRYGKPLLWPTITLFLLIKNRFFTLTLSGNNGIVDDLIVAEMACVGQLNSFSVNQLVEVGTVFVVFHIGLS